MRAAFILPYFGKFDELFPLFLLSCKKNSELDWYIITDCLLPEWANEISNVKFIKTDFRSLGQRIQANYDFKISLNKPYRLCNFKPAYGELFQDYLAGYDYWGYCDCDLIWGRIGKLFSENAGKYDRIGIFGHCTLLRNTQEINTLYRKKGAYKIVFQNDYSFLFDEIGFKEIWDLSGFSTAPDFYLGDFYPRRFSFQSVCPVGECPDKPGQQIFSWSDGVLSRYAIVNNEVLRNEVVYIHFLKRHISVYDEFRQEKPYLIIPNKIEVKVQEVTKDYILSNTKPRFHFEYWRAGLSWRKIYQKLRQRFSVRRKSLMHEILSRIEE